MAHQAEHAENNSHPPGYNLRFAKFHGSFSFVIQTNNGSRPQGKTSNTYNTGNGWIVTQFTATANPVRAGVRPPENDLPAKGTGHL